MPTIPTIPQEYIITICAALIVWLVLKIIQCATDTWVAISYSRPNKDAEYQRAFELAWQYGEQLLEKHGADKNTIENIVLDWATKYMLSVGMTPPARNVAVGIIRAVGRQYNESKKNGE